MALPFGKSGLSTPSTLEAKILAFLGEYGAYIPSYELPERLDRSFGSPIDEPACRKALDALIAKKLVSTSPDQPSMVKIAQASPDLIGMDDQPKGESGIMPHLKHYLRGDFCAVIEGKAGAGYLVIDTSYKGPTKGTWRRPDFTVVNVIDLPLLGRRQIDVHSFELKTETGCTVPSVFEALSQARETHYAYLAWDLPEGSPRRADLPEIEDACTLHGIGLITMVRKGQKGFGHLRIRPRRRASSDLDVHRYLLDRLDQEQRTWLSAEASKGQ